MEFVCELDGGMGNGGVHVGDGVKVENLYGADCRS